MIRGRKMRSPDLYAESKKRRMDLFGRLNSIVIPSSNLIGKGCYPALSFTVKDLCKNPSSLRLDAHLPRLENGGQNLGTIIPILGTSRKISVVYPNTLFLIAKRGKEFAEFQIVVYTLRLSLVGHKIILYEEKGHE